MFTTLFNTGDIAHHHLLTLHNPKVKFVFDTDAEQSAASRIRASTFAMYAATSSCVWSPMRCPATTRMQASGWNSNSSRSGRWRRISLKIVVELTSADRPPDFAVLRYL